MLRLQWRKTAIAFRAGLAEDSLPGALRGHADHGGFSIPSLHPIKASGQLFTQIHRHNDYWSLFLHEVFGIIPAKTRFSCMAWRSQLQGLLQPCLPPKPASRCRAALISPTLLALGDKGTASHALSQQHNLLISKHLPADIRNQNSITFLHWCTQGILLVSESSMFNLRPVIEN